ncbi:hypothetical protein HWV62_16242 [Athelia sp. TMB]|nr:hypothetical protein HWV62_16242 [Athelia sp. TMB]
MAADKKSASKKAERPSTMNKTSSAKSVGTASKNGAPAQHTQGSRKGKRAWRKNVDIGEVEIGLEEMRAEERVVGKTLQKHQDDELFQIDVKGDDQVRKQLPRFSTSQLTSSKILAARSAVPAVFSRPQLPTVGTKRKAGPYISPEEKARLLRIGKRLRKGPLNSAMDPTEFGAGSAILEVSEAAKSSGRYDPWAVEAITELEMPDGMETVHKPKIKRPTLAHPKDVIEIPAIAEPHQGTSYNPPVDAHTELILKAGDLEERRAKEAERLVEVKQRIGKAVTTAGVTQEGVPEGMVVDERGDDEDAEGEEEGEGPLAKKPPTRKTKQQKSKAARQRAEKRALAERLHKKLMLSSISSVKALRREGSSVSRRLSEAELQRKQRQLALLDKMRKGGLQGMRIGRHKVPEREVDVQLGEDLSESLRALKPEGNLFRDRFQSLQQRALVEPRVLVLPSKRTFKIKEYEKHAWKKFDRD